MGQISTGSSAKTLIGINNLLKRTNSKNRYILFGIISSMIGAIFEVISIGLLIPTLEGIISMDFTFIEKFQISRNIIASFPGLFYYYNIVVFSALILIIFLAVLLKNIFYYISSILFAKQTKIITNNLRKLLFHRYLSFPKQFFDRENKGYLQNVIVNFIHEISYGLTTIFRSSIYLFMLVAYMIIMLIVSWQLTLLVVMLFPIIHFSLSWIIKNIEKTSSAWSSYGNMLSEHTFNVLSCIPLVKAYDNEKSEKKRFSEISEAYSNLEYTQNKKRELIIPLQEIILITFILILISAMAYLFVKEETGMISNFLVFFYVLKRSSTMFNQIGDARGKLAALSGPLENIKKMLDDKGKIIFKQKRLGHNQKHFMIYKFRSMIEDAESIKERYKSLNYADGPVFKIKDDPRHTKLGKFLAKTMLDELPQLFNILKGEMHFVGFRPPTPDEVQRYEKWHLDRFKGYPGLTSSWAVNGMHSIKFDDWIKRDIKYSKNESFLTDAQIISKTATKFLKSMINAIISEK